MRLFAVLLFAFVIRIRAESRALMTIARIEYADKSQHNEGAVDKNDAGA
jgi:hypothetical protein